MDNCGRRPNRGFVHGWRLGMVLEGEDVYSANFPQAQGHFFQGVCGLS